MKKLLSILLSAAMVLSLAACGGGGGTSANSGVGSGSGSGGNASNPVNPPSSGETVSLRFSLSNSADSVHGRNIQRWCDNIAAAHEKGETSVELTMFPNGQLGSVDEMLEQIMMGENIVLSTDPAALKNFAPELGILEAPYFFENEEEPKLVFQTQWFADQLATLEENGIKVLSGEMIYGSRHIMATAPIHGPQDMKGLKIRVPANDLSAAMIETMGGTATPMPLADVYAGIQQKTINGIEVVTLTVQDIYERWIGVLRAQRELVSETMAQIRAKVDRCGISEENLEKVAALKLAIGQAADELGCRAGCVNCSDPLRNITGIMPCFVLGDLTGDGLPMICESDVHGAISSVMALAASQAAGCEYPTFLMDLTNRHELDDNMELLWHCGVFPLALKKEGTVSELTCHYGAPKEGTCRVSIRNGPISLLRFDGTHDKYSVLMARGKIVDGPETNCTYGWGEFENWPALEEKLIYGPYIHHIVGVYADIAPMIYEALRYIEGVEPDFFSPTVEEIQRAMRE